MTNNPTPPGEMSPQAKRDLLEKLLKEKAAKANSELPLRTERIPLHTLDRSQRYFPLSSAQQRLWLLDQFDPDNPVYNISIIFRLKGDLNIKALEQSLVKILNRHEILRVNFTQSDGKPVQFLVPERTLPLSIIDLKDIPASTRPGEAEKLAEQDAQHSFDLTNDPLARANLFQLAEDDHLFQFIIHHIIFDGWSLNVLLQELTFFYTKLSNNEEASLAPLPVQYIDFAGWEASQLDKGFPEEHINYWKKQLGGVLPLLEMPLDKPRPETQSFRAGKEVLNVSPTLTQSLTALSRQEGVTLFVTMLSAFYALLARYTAQEDIIVGTPIARRSHADVEKLIGVFINNLALRTDLSGNVTFQELLKRVRRTALDAFAHQDIPFEKLLSDLRIERDSSHSPVFQVFFNLLDVRKGAGLELPNLSVETPSLPEIGSIFDVTLYVQNWGDTLKLKLVYNSDLFHDQSMTEFLQRYHHLLEQIAENPRQLILVQPLPSQTKQKQADIIKKIGRLNNEFTAFTDEDLQQSIASRFEQQVESFSQHIAVKTPRHQWTYEKLNQAANRAAHAILSQCQETQERVALLFEHDAPMLAGLLGALKAGKTYIPLDPHYPQERLVYMLTDSQSSVIITNNGQIELASQLAGTGIKLINIDELQSNEHMENPRLFTPPDQLAYILYTSGSTGQPKGVMQNHRNVLHFIKAYTDNLHIGALDRLSLLSSYSFDAAVMDIFGALLNGATLYPIDAKNEGLLDLASYLNESRISIYHSTPTVYRYFIDSLNAVDKFPFIRLIVLGGEAVVKRDINLFKKHFSDDCVFINGLGPTESTVSLQYFVDKQIEIVHNTVPVGYPVEETEVILLNESGEEVPLLGEIAIRSKYVALGYWKKPEITQSAFGLNLQQNGKRTYRTGDMGRLLPDGTIEFRGRKDFQIKIRGHRVELGEVETRLAEHPMIKECVITSSDDGSGGKRLVAYYVHNGTQPVDGEIRHFLQSKLPDYMTPAIFVPIKSLPLTPTGKVDRRALPEPRVESHNLLVGAPAAARNQTEEKLGHIWQELLQLRSIDVRDNFFELGGHSLMAVHMFARIKQEFGVNLPLATLFRGATIEYLADLINNRSKSGAWSSLIEIEPQGNHAPFYCVHGLTGDILWFRDLARCFAPDYPFYGLQSRGLDGIQAPLMSIEDMAAHYIKETRQLQPKGPYYLGGASFGGTIVLEIAQQLLAQGEEVSMLAIFDHVPPNVFDVDSSKGKIKNRLIAGYRIMKNFPYWLKEFVHIGPDRMLMRIRRKLRLIQKAKGQTDIHKLGQFDAEDLIDFAAELSAHRQQLITANYKALKSYIPKPYAGRVTLFRAQNRPLLNTHDPELGWQSIAPGRVDVYDIPSSHEGMFKKPHVEYLAEKLKAAINQTNQK